MSDVDWNALRIMTEAGLTPDIIRALDPNRAATKTKTPGTPPGSTPPPNYAPKPVTNILDVGADAAKKKPEDGPGPGARSYLQSLLSQYGLESLTDWAFNLMTQGYEVQYIMAELRNQQAFKDRFPAIALRQAAGLPPLSPQEYVDLEKSYDGFMRASGLDNMFDRKSLYTKWIAGEVSPAEAKARADEAYGAVQGEPIETRMEFQRMFGTGAGAAAVAYFLDPAQSLQKIQEQFKQAQIGGASIRSTYGLLSVDEAQRLQQLGVTVDQANTGFGDLAHKTQLLNLLPGEAGDSIARQDALNAEFAGDAATQQRITDIASRRKAAVEGGGQYRRTQKGVAGLGSSTN